MTNERSPRLSDELLISAIRRAVREQLGPGEVEQQVGERAWINTRRGSERQALRMANIGADDLQGQTVLRALGEAAEVVYWGRPVDATNPRIVGIVWHADQSPEIFFGVVYPP